MIRLIRTIHPIRVPESFSRNTSYLSDKTITDVLIPPFPGPVWQAAPTWVWVGPLLPVVGGRRKIARRTGEVEIHVELRKEEGGIAELPAQGIEHLAERGTVAGAVNLRGAGRAVGTTGSNRRAASR